MIKKWNQQWKHYCRTNTLYFQIRLDENGCSFLHQLTFQDAYWIDDDRFVIEFHVRGMSCEYAGTTHTLFPTSFTAPFSLEEKEFMLACMNECGVFNWMNTLKERGKQDDSFESSEF